MTVPKGTHYRITYIRFIGSEIWHQVAYLSFNKPNIKRALKGFRSFFDQFDSECMITDIRETDYDNN